MSRNDENERGRAASRGTDSRQKAAGLAGVVGQERLMARLRQLLAQGVPGHAYAFTGVAGMGKRTITHAFAAHWLCLGPGEAPCGACRACLMFGAGTHPDVCVIRPENRKIPIEAIRGMQAAFAERAVFGRRLCILEEAELMNEAAQNCLLKTLEEPPPHTLILLTTGAYDTLQTTIRSRVIRLPLDGYTQQELDLILERRAAGRATDFLAAFSQGVPGRAMTLLESRTLDANRQRVLALLPEGARGGSGLEALWRHLGENKAEFAEATELVQGLLRDLLAALEGADGRLIHTDKTDTIKKVARSRTREEWLAGMDRVEAIRQAVRDNLNHQLAVDALNASLGPLFGQ